MNRFGRDEPLPPQMQGCWTVIDDPLSELVVNGGKITYLGSEVIYDHKVISEEDGALSVTLGIDDDARMDTFQRENITGLVITPENRFVVYNVRFALECIRPLD